ncbi:hypothetical protein Taro_015879 [Colocasia esculenta]|uniref:Uncharacterized protein n=1 Tax=Colocasia esculenta TaxID=4460 RepID=A0A843UJ42_COLES|nr:hypothetical protein [Colocasia esculenta]
MLRRGVCDGDGGRATLRVRRPGRGCDAARARERVRLPGGDCAGEGEGEVATTLADLTQAISMVSFYTSSSEPAQVRGKTVYIQYSNIQEVRNNKSCGDVAGNVLLVTIEGVEAGDVSIDVIHLFNYSELTHFLFDYFDKINGVHLPPCLAELRAKKHLKAKNIDEIQQLLLFSRAQRSRSSSGSRSSLLLASATTSARVKPPRPLRPIIAQYSPARHSSHAACAPECGLLVPSRSPEQSIFKLQHRADGPTTEQTPCSVPPQA